MPNTEPEKRVHVAVGVILDADRRILIALRPQNTHQGGLWEFPGGKVEADESVQTALARELYEEVAIEVVNCRPLTQVRHDYADKQVLLDVWWVEAFRGQPRGGEGQPIRWVGSDELQHYPFPAANAPIVAAVRDALIPANTQES